MGGRFAPEFSIGRKMFAVDGCKISSNCAKEWSGTKTELRKKAEKIEESVKMLLARHKDDDAVAETDPGGRVTDYIRHQRTDLRRNRACVTAGPWFLTRCSRVEALVRPPAGSDAEITVPIIFI